jgi:hypothetical protein
VNPFDYAECALWRRGRPTRAKIQDLHRGWFREGIPLVVELDAWPQIDTLPCDVHVGVKAGRSSPHDL